MIAQQRKAYIMNELYSKSIVNIKDTAKALNVSEITIRRDFEKLEAEGKLKRVQGGATLDTALDNAELTMKNKMGLNAPNKLIVAKYAASLIHDGDCVFVDGGTTMAPLIDILVMRPIRLVTYSSLVVRNVFNPSAEIFVVGGKYLPHYSMFIGADAQDTLKRYHFNVAFLGCSGVSLDDNFCYTTEIESLQMKRIAAENSDKRYLMFDDSKLNHPGFLRFMVLNLFDEIICNAGEGVKTEELPANFTTV